MDERDCILHSWKEIADYLKCDRKTCAKWETQFDLPVRRVETESGRARVFAYAAEIDRWRAARGAASTETSAAGPAKRSRRFSPLYAAAATVALLTPAAWLVFRNIFPIHIPTIAVAPLAASGGGDYDAYLAEWLTKNIISLLAVPNKVKVIAVPAGASSALRRIGKGAPAVEVNYSLRGEVRLDEAEVSLTLHLDDVAENREAWTKTYAENRAKFGSLVDEIVSDIRQNASLPGKPGATRSSQPGEDVLDPVLRGSYLLTKVDGRNNSWSLYHEGMLYAGQGDKEANELAIRIFRRAVDANPNFGPAYLGLAQCFANYLNFGWNAETHWLDKADELTEKGRSLPPLIASAFALRIELLLIREALFGGDSSDLRFAIAREGLARFPADGPLNSIVGYCYLRRFETKGDERDFDEALRYKETAYWAEPYALGNVVLAELYMLKKDFDGALAICDDLRRFLNSGDVDYRRGQILYYMGDFARSEGAFRDMDENTEVWLGSLGHLGMIAAARKDADGAARILRQIELLRPKSDGQYGLDLRLASIYAGLGQSDKAREHLRDFSAQDRYKAAPFLYAKYIAIDKNFDSIRTDIVLAY